MAVACAAGLLSSIEGSSILAQTSPPREVSRRIATLEAWLSALERHQLGTADEAVTRISQLRSEDLTFLEIDVRTLVSLVRQPDVLLFFIADARGFQRRQVVYSVGELRRLRELSKAIAGRGQGAENQMLKRAAMLHADIAMLAPPEGRPTNGFSGRVTLLMDDGQRLGLEENVAHFDIGRRLLDLVRPVDSKKPNMMPDPGIDATVRMWYVATGAFMQSIRRIDTTHFDRALALFPDHADVLFSVAVAHETYAGVRMQSALRSASNPLRTRFGIGSEGGELRRAEQLYRRALEREPTMSEARIRLGRVLGLRGRHEEAARELRQAITTASGSVLQYYAALFFGNEAEALGNHDEARLSYERAAALYPLAQSPRLAISRLASQVGDATAARDAIQHVLTLPSPGEERVDPWWTYETSASRNVERLFSELRKRI